MTSFALPLAGASDIVENLISFVMLADPLGFPNWLALVYSSTAVLKFGFWTLGLCWLAVSLAALVLSTLSRPLLRWLRTNPGRVR